MTHLIVGGTEKAGTSALFSSLSRHPQLSPSRVKETDFFRSAPLDDPPADRRGYEALFVSSDCSRLRLEASPGYLRESATVAPRIARLLPGAGLVFVLRDPTDRLYSFFQFNRAQLNLPAELEFETFVRYAMEHENGTRSPGRSGISAWCLGGLVAGNYGAHLEQFLARFARRSILVLDYGALLSSPDRLLEQICEFANVPAQPLRTLVVPRQNVTFFGRCAALHRIAVRANKRLEPQLNRRPRIKRLAVAAYKALNQRKAGYAPMSTAMRRTLDAYYEGSNRRLVELFPESARFAWLRS